MAMMTVGDVCARLGDNSAIDLISMWDERYVEGIVRGIEASIFVMRSDEPDKIAQLEGICSRLRAELVQEFLGRNDVLAHIPEKVQKVKHTRSS